MKPSSNKTRRRVVRGVLAAVYVAILALMLITGRQHTILIDNKDAADGSYTAIDGMSVQIDRLESSEYYPGDRDKAVVKGQKHKIKVEIFAEGKIEERVFTVPFGLDMALLSVPGLLAGADDWLIPFTVRLEQAGAADAPANQVQQFGGDAAPADSAAPAAPPLIQ